MRNYLFIMLITLLMATAVGCEGGDSGRTPVEINKLETVEVKTDWDSISYSFGFHGTEMMAKDTNVKINKTLYLRGVLDALEGELRADKRLLEEEGIKLSYDLYNVYYNEIMKNVTDQKMKEDSILAITLVTDGKEVLAKNAKDPEFTTTPSGLQYKLIKKGNGRFVKPDEATMLHFISKLTNGTEFVNTYKPRSQPGMPESSENNSEGTEEPKAIDADKVPPGWAEAMKMMDVGSKYIFYMPPELMYGERGLKNQSSTIVPPNAVIIMEIEMFEPIPKDQVAPPPAQR